MTRSKPKNGEHRHRTQVQGDHRRHVISRIQLSGKDQLVISADGNRLDLRAHEDVTGCGAYMATARGLAIPRDRVAELIEQLEEAQKVLVDA